MISFQLLCVGSRANIKLMRTRSSEKLEGGDGRERQSTYAMFGAGKASVQLGLKYDLQACSFPLLLPCT